MATNPLDMPILISQLPNLQQMLGPQIVPPEAQQMLFGQMVADNQRKEDQNVQKVEKEDGLDAMGKDSGGNKQAAHQHQQPRQRLAADPDQTANTTQSSNASPWAGNIINVKI